MSNLFNIPGFPPPEKQDTLDFMYLKNFLIPKECYYIYLILIGF